MKKSKPAPKKKAVAKSAPKKAAAKPAAKTAAKPAAKKTAVAAKSKAPAKPAGKASAKPAAKAAAKPAVKPAAKKTPKVTAKPVEKSVAKATAPVKAVAAKVATKVETKKPEKTAKLAAPVAAPKAAEAKAPKLTKAELKASIAAAKAAAPAEAFPALDPDVKRPSKPFFMEVKPGVERVIKRGDKSAVSQVIDLQARRKGPTAEETSDELAERIERELQTQSFSKRARMRPQMCTKCGINAVTPRFTIDRELGYCEICAEILHLGETKEARRMEISLAAKKEDDEIAGPEDGPPEEADDEAVPEELED